MSNLQGGDATEGSFLRGIPDIPSPEDEEIGRQRRIEDLRDQMHVLYVELRELEHATRVRSLEPFVGKIYKTAHSQRVEGEIGYFIATHIDSGDVSGVRVDIIPNRRFAIYRGDLEGNTILSQWEEIPADELKTARYAWMANLKNMVDDAMEQLGIEIQY